jgi:ubiquinone/menaquinone biosynthesis C-methylase UbiE
MMIEDFIFYGGISIAVYLIVARIIRRYYKFPVPSFVGYFLGSRFRKMMQPPDKIVERSGIKEGMTVMDLGCGPGTYTVDVARAVGNKGKVYAVDIQQAMINRLENKLKKPENKDVHNIIPKVANAYELPFSNDSLDLVYMVAVLQEIPDKQRALREVYRVLKNNGILAVSEFLPDPDYPLRSTTRRMCEEAGFRLKGNYGNIFNYTLQFEKSNT